MLTISGFQSSWMHGQDHTKKIAADQGASGNRKTSTYGTYLPRFEPKKICQIAAGRKF
jgi:hypothetical protein